MPLLVRKIEKAKWLQNDVVNGQEVSADAITYCLKTTKNALSTWRVLEIDEIDEGVLAIVSGHEHLETIDIVCLDCSSLKSAGLKLQISQGTTPVANLADRHVDILELTYRSLGIIADQIVGEFRGDKVKRYTRNSLKTLLNEAIQKGRLKKDDLNESLREKL
jgi:hypothetical protein